MKLNKILLLILVCICANTFSQTITQKPLLPNANKQETVDWIASKFKYHHYKKSFVTYRDTLNYGFVDYNLNKIHYLAQVIWADFGPEMSNNHYTINLNNIKKVIFDSKTGSLSLEGKNVLEYKYYNEPKRIWCFNTVELCHPFDKEKHLPIFYEASPRLLKSLAGAFEKIVKFN